MDLSPIANLALSMAGMVVVPIAGIVAHRAIDLAQKKLHLQMSIETQRQVEAAIDAGAGVLRAKLANGHITLSDVKQLVMDNDNFQVVDAKSGEDLTRSILLQIILDEEAAGQRAHERAGGVRVREAVGGEQAQVLLAGEDGARFR